MTEVAVEQASALVTTPESYLGAARADRFLNGPIVPGTHRYRAPEALRLRQPRLRGNVADRPRRRHLGAALATAPRLRRPPRLPRARLARRHSAQRAGDARRRADRGRLAGRDVRDGRAAVRRQRLYRLVELPRAERHLLTLDFAPASPATPSPSDEERPLRQSSEMAQQADRRTVLVVDDEPTISEVVARYLERAGYATADGRRRDRGAAGRGRVRPRPRRARPDAARAGRLRGPAPAAGRRRGSARRSSS